MSRIRRLNQSYGQFIAIPWRETAAAQRVIFCVYPETDELRLRGSVGEFELTTRQAGHEWFLFDLTDTFPHWLSDQRYAKSYFQKPQLLASLLPRYLVYLTERFEGFLRDWNVGDSAVVALMGVGSLFGFLKVKDMVDKFAPLVKGKLLVFFPGSYEDNNYRLLDGYDGWNYLAVPITAGKEF